MTGEEGLTLAGFQDFFQDQLTQLVRLTNSAPQSEQIIFKWLEHLGYDKDLYPIRSRCFVLSMHSERPLQVDVRDATQTDIDTRTCLLILEKFGQELKKSKQGYRLLYSFSDKIFGYSYAVQNIKSKKIKVRLDCSKSESMLFSTPTSIIEKTIEAGATEFFMHSMAAPSEGKFVRSAECTILEKDE